MMQTTDKPRVLMIGLDAAEPSLIERWTSDGSLPNLRALRDRGVYTRLKSPSEWLVGSPWPTFYTSTTPADHGLYHYIMWRAGEMQAVRPSPEWLPLEPFWRALSARGPRVVAVDVPLTYKPAPFNGLELGGWASHDLLVPPYAVPDGTLDRVTQRYGPPPRSDEAYRLTRPDEFLAIRDELVENARRVRELSLGLMRDEAWDLFVTVFGSTHRGGHKLWNTRAIDGDVPAARRAEYDDALKNVYQSVDEAVGRIVEAAGPDTDVMVFSLHGMGFNTCRTDMLREMLQRVLAGGPPQQDAAKKPGVLKRLRNLVPNDVRHAVKQRLPLSLQDKLTAFWRMGGIDWSRTKAVSMVADLQGYIRFNVKGREPQGIVERGAEYDALCEEIERGLRTFVDADTGAPIVEGVMRSGRLYPEGARRDDLPDLLVRWTDTPVADHRAIRSPVYGEIAWPTPGRNGDGRAGNHRFQGFLAAAGPTFAKGVDLASADVMDLAPTACHILGAPPLPTMRGRSLLAGH